MRETLKHDYAAGGDASKAFAAMQLDIMRELLDDSPRLTLYHLRSDGETREITPDYAGVAPNDAMRIRTDGVDGKNWYILTIDGSGEVGLFAPGELVSADDGLWSWQPTAPPSETVLLLACTTNSPPASTRDDRIHPQARPQRLWTSAAAGRPADHLGRRLRRERRLENRGSRPRPARSTRSFRRNTLDDARVRRTPQDQRLALRRAHHRRDEPDPRVVKRPLSMLVHHRTSITAAHERVAAEVPLMARISGGCGCPLTLK